MANAIQGIEPRRHRLRSLWLIGRWAIAAILAVCTALYVAGTSTGSQRIVNVIAAWYGESVELPAGATPAPDAVALAGLQSDLENLTDTIRTLEADRDQLTQRVATLERGIQDVTGSIARQATTPHPRAEPKPEPPAARPRVADPVPMPPAPTTPVAPGFVLLEPALGLDRAPVTAESSQETWSMIPLPRSGQRAAPQPQTQPQAPMQTATIATHQQDQPDAPDAPKRPEFGVDLGGATTVESLRALWSTQRARLPALGQLTPSVVSRTGNRQGGNLRLVAGPLPTAASAAQLCAALTSQRVACQPAHYDGQPLALR